MITSVRNAPPTLDSPPPVRGYRQCRSRTRRLALSVSAGWVALLLVCSPGSWLDAATDLTLFGAWAPGGTLASTKLKDFAGFGATFEKYFAIVGFENTFTYYTRPVDITGSGDAGLALTSGLTLNIPFYGKFGYVAAGAGFFRKQSSLSLDQGTRFLSNIGGGVKLRKLAGALGLRLDYRRCRISNIRGQAYGFNQISGGLMVSFD